MNIRLDMYNYIFMSNNVYSYMHVQFPNVWNVYGTAIMYVRWVEFIFPLYFLLLLYLFFGIIAGNESCPQPQTSEHLAAIEIMKLKHIIILQNKIDLIRDTQAKDQYQEILKFVQGIHEAQITNVHVNVSLTLTTPRVHICTRKQIVQ